MGWKILNRVSTWFAFNLVALVALIVVHFGLSVTTLKWWADTFAVATNLLAGSLVSFLFYFLVVHLPEARKKATIKANLQKLYRGIKEDILLQVVFASIKGGRRDISTDTETLQKLMTPEGFKEAFRDGREADGLPNKKRRPFGRRLRYRD